MVKINFDASWYGMGGIGRFAEEISSRLNSITLVDLGSPVSPLNSLKITFWLIRHPRSFFLSPGFNAPMTLHSRFAFVVHDLNHIENSANSSFLKKLYYRFVIKRACINAAAVFTVSKYAAERISTWAGIPTSKVEVVGNGVSEVFSPTGPRMNYGMKYIFCVGNRKKHKNEKTVVDSFAKIIDNTDCMLVFSGDPDIDLIEHIKSRELQSRVHFTGLLTEESLAEHYRGARLSIFLSTYEGFGLPVVESMACGTPVVASNTTSIPEVAGNAAVLVDPYSAYEAAAAALKLLTDDEFHCNLQQAGLNRAAEFNWSKVAKRIQKKLDSSWKDK